MANNPYKELNSKVTMARQQFANGELTPLEFKQIIKGFYEEYLSLEEEKKTRETEQIINNLRFTD